MNLYQKIIEVRKVADSFKKDVEKDGLKYTYVSGNQILSKIKTCMNEQSLILQPSIKVGHHERFDYKTQYGKDLTDFIVKGEMSYTWINAEKPDDREVVEWAYYGQQNEISKALGSALTYSERYFLLKYFGLPTDEDDPDGKLPPKQEEPKSTKPTTPTTPKAPYKAPQKPQTQPVQQEKKPTVKYITTDQQTQVKDIFTEKKWNLTKTMADKWHITKIEEMTDVMYQGVLEAIAK